jgi:hypothetical protein
MPLLVPPNSTVRARAWSYASAWYHNGGGALAVGTSRQLLPSYSQVSLRVLKVASSPPNSTTRPRTGSYASAWP